MSAMDKTVEQIDAEFEEFYRKTYMLNGVTVARFQSKLVKELMLEAYYAGRGSAPVAAQTAVSDEEILRIAAQLDYGWLGIDGVTPFTLDEDDAKIVIGLCRAILAVQKGGA